MNGRLLAGSNNKVRIGQVTFHRAELPRSHLNQTRARPWKMGVSCFSGIGALKKWLWQLFCHGPLWGRVPHTSSKWSIREKNEKKDRTTGNGRVVVNGDSQEWRSGFHRGFPSNTNQKKNREKNAILPMGVAWMPFPVFQRSDRTPFAFSGSINFQHPNEPTAKKNGEFSKSWTFACSPTCSS